MPGKKIENQKRTKKSRKQPKVDGLRRKPIRQSTELVPKVEVGSKIEVVALQKNIRMTPQKLRLVADLVRGLDIDEALKQLRFLRKRAADPVYKTIKQAMANAVNNLKINKDKLVIGSIEIMEGPIFKRWRPVSRGRAHTYFKRTSHIKVILEGD